MLAAEHPERVGALIMYASIARTSWAPDYDWAMTAEEREALSERNIASWGEADSDAMRRGRRRWPRTRRSSAGSRACSAWPRARARRASSPGRWSTSTCATLLPRIRVPTLIMHRPRRARVGRAPLALPGRAHPGRPLCRARGNRLVAVRRRQRRDRRGGRGVPHGRAQRRRIRARPADGAVHRHRRRDRARGEARRRPLARPARPPRRAGAGRAGALRWTRGQDRGRRLPGDLRRPPLARPALRPGDHRAPPASSASRCVSACTPASAS